MQPRHTLHAGEKLTFAATAYDKCGRSVEIKAKGLPEGADIVNTTDPLLKLPKAVINWQSSTDLEDLHYKVVLRAVAKDNETHTTVVSSPKTVKIDVLPAAQSDVDHDDSVVANNVIGAARLNSKSKKLEVSGQLVFDRDSTVAERKAVIAEKKVAIITDAISGAVLGKAKVQNNGKWAAVVAIGNAPVPSSVDVSFDGKRGVKAVAGVKKTHP